MQKHHFHMINGMFAIMAGVVGLSGVITTFEAQMATLPVSVQPVLTHLTTNTYSQPLTAATQVLGFSVIDQNAKSITVQAHVATPAAGLQFAFVPRIVQPKKVAFLFDPASAVVQDAAVHAIDWTVDNTFTLPIDASIAGKWITVYAFVKNSDGRGAAAALPGNIDSAGAIIFQIPAPSLQ